MLKHRYSLDNGCKLFLKITNVGRLEHTTIPWATKKQVVCYIENIRLPPTREDAEKEALKRSQAVAKECGEKYVIVTYDLAVARIVRSPELDVCFLKFGQFHTILSWYSSMVKY